MNHFTHKSDLILEALEMAADAQAEILACMNGRDYAEYTDEERETAQAKLKDFILARNHAQILHPHQMQKRIKAARDAAHDAGMISEDALNAELDSIADKLAKEVFAARPDLDVMSVDEWYFEHMEELDEYERAAVIILAREFQ